jgi:hypothetical protein
MVLNGASLIRQMQESLLLTFKNIHFLLRIGSTNQLVPMPFGFALLF